MIVSNHLKDPDKFRPRRDTTLYCAASMQVTSCSCARVARTSNPIVRKYCGIRGSAIGPILAASLLMSQHSLLELPPTTKDKAWRVVIETPRGSHNKYNLEPKLGAFELGHVLPEGMVFPYDFGFVPSTLGDDGDPLDVLLFMDQSTFVGCVVPAQLVGVIEAKQTQKEGKWERNDRLIAVPTDTHRYQHIRSMKDIEKDTIQEIEDFFIAYNKERGRKFKVLAVHGPKHAVALVRDGMKKFVKKHSEKAKQKKH